jgi:hypothetical protein
VLVRPRLGLVLVPVLVQEQERLRQRRVYDDADW